MILSYNGLLWFATTQLFRVRKSPHVSGCCCRCVLKLYACICVYTLPFLLFSLIYTIYRKNGKHRKRMLKDRNISRFLMLPMMLLIVIVGNIGNKTICFPTINRQHFLGVESKNNSTDYSILRQWSTPKAIHSNEPQSRFTWIVPTSSTPQTVPLQP